MPDGRTCVNFLTNKIVSAVLKCLSTTDVYYARADRLIRRVHAILHAGGTLWVTTKHRGKGDGELAAIVQVLSASSLALDGLFPAASASGNSQPAIRVQAACLQDYCYANS